MKQKKYNLEDRFVNYTCLMRDIVESLPNTRAANYSAGQLIKSCHSSTFNYGEAQAAKSRNDFIHKMGIILKELKECRTALKIIKRKEMIKSLEKLDEAYKETEELISIIGKSIFTVKSNNKST